MIAGFERPWVLEKLGVVRVEKLGVVDVEKLRVCRMRRVVIAVIMWSCIK